MLASCSSGGWATGVYTVMACALVGLLPGCAAPGDAAQTADASPGSFEHFRVAVTHDPGMRFPSTGSFTFALARLPSDPRWNAAEAEERLRRAIIDELGAKGFRLGDGQPTFQVAAYVLAGDAVPVGSEGAPGVAAGGDAEGDPMVEGALVIDLIHPETLRPIWRGVCGADVLVNVAADEKLERGRYAVARIFEAFPPPAARESR